MTKRRAMIAEDSIFILMALEMILKNHNVEVIGYSSTIIEVQVIVEECDFEIAILDINLHGENIFSVADLIIQRSIPIIFTSGYSENELIPSHLITVPYLQKPYNPDTLIALIENAFQGESDN